MKIEDGEFDVYDKKDIKLGESFETTINQTEGGVVKVDFTLKDDKDTKNK